jgi:predicted DNA-binding transcriptional regulator
MTTLSPDEVALIRSLLTALRGIKVRDIDKALVILSKSDRARDSVRGDRSSPND